MATDPDNKAPTPGNDIVVAGLVGGLVIVILAAMAVSYNALEATATTIGAGNTAWIYPCAVDGLVGLAVVTSLVLKGAKGHKFAVGVLIGYTLASAILNVWHGAAAANPTGLPSWLRVVIAAALPVGINAFGTHLVVLVLQHLKPGKAAAAAGSKDSAGSTVPAAGRQYDTGQTAHTVSGNAAAVYGPTAPAAASVETVMAPVAPAFSAARAAATRPTVPAQPTTAVVAAPPNGSAADASGTTAAAAAAVAAAGAKTATTGSGDSDNGSALPDWLREGIELALPYYRQHVTDSGKEPTGKAIGIHFEKSESWGKQIRTAIRKVHPNEVPKFYTVPTEVAS